jgi:magnesium transporter
MPQAMTPLDASAKILAGTLARLSPAEAASQLRAEPDERSAAALLRLNSAAVVDILWHLEPAQRERVIAAAPGGSGEQWRVDRDYPEESVGRLMEHPLAVFSPQTAVAEAIEALRDLVQGALITYGFVVDENGTLVGVFTFRDLLFAGSGMTLGDIMLREPFSLRPDMALVVAMRSVVVRHFPAYPVCDASGRLLGMVRGQALFERQAFEISAQAGRMVGVEKEERLHTPWWRSFRSRHPWLQLNLLTAFIAAAVVGFFQDTVDRIVVLAAFLPVLAGQSGNTGCQALAVTLRGLTLGEIERGAARRLVFKEALLGLLNGLFVGVVAGAGMWAYAHRQEHPQAMLLGVIVVFAMIGACVASGVCGALVPLGLKRVGADPATASSIFLTTSTDVASMGIFLALATWLVR